MPYNSAVTWWEYHGKSKPKRVDYICFASIAAMPDKIKYLAHADRVSEGEVKFYMKFLGQAFGFIHQFHAKRVVRDGKPKVMWTLHSKGMKRPCMLLYLTAFRAIHEQWEQVKYLYDHREKDGKIKGIEALWDAFHQAHKELPLANPHHALMSPTGHYGTPLVPTPLKTFQSRVKSQEPANVYGYFQ